MSLKKELNRISKPMEYTAYSIPEMLMYATGESSIKKAKLKAEAKYPNIAFTYSSRPFPELVKKLAPIMKKNGAKQYRIWA